MTGEAIAFVVVVATVLLAIWALANRRHVRRRRRQASEWSGSGARPDLWTSAARCPHCGASGGLLEMEGEAMWFVCLACGRRHRRESRG